jgi:hypothetical protein
MFACNQAKVRTRPNSLEVIDCIPEPWLHIAWHHPLCSSRVKQGRSLQAETKRSCEVEVQYITRNFSRDYKKKAYLTDISGLHARLFSAKAVKIVAEADSSG